jgi:hypothetical protein
MAFNESYKRWHKPDTSPNAKTKQGYYRVQNPQKYMGNPGLVIFRSSWEYVFCRWCDFSPSIIHWSSEPIRIPYYDRVSKLEDLKRQGLDPNNPKNWVIKYYNTDFWIEIDQGEGKTQKMFVEIKASSKLKKPIPPSDNAPLREIRRFNILAKEYLINEAKFKALEAWAERNGALFKVFTEETLRNVAARFWEESIQKTK